MLKTFIYQAQRRLLGTENRLLGTENRLLGTAIDVTKRADAELRFA